MRLTRGSFQCARVLVIVKALLFFRKVVCIDFEKGEEGEEKKKISGVGVLD